MMSHIVNITGRHTIPRRRFREGRAVALSRAIVGHTCDFVAEISAF